MSGMITGEGHGVDTYRPGPAQLAALASVGQMMTKLQYESHKGCSAGQRYVPGIASEKTYID